MRGENADYRFPTTPGAYIWPGPNAGDGANQDENDDEEDDDDGDNEEDEDDDEDSENGGGIDGKDEVEVEKLIWGKGDTDGNDGNDGNDVSVEDYSKPVLDTVPKRRNRATGTLVNSVAQSSQGSKNDRTDIGREDEPNRHVLLPGNAANPRPNAPITIDSSDEEADQMKSQPQTWPKWGLRE